VGPHDPLLVVLGFAFRAAGLDRVDAELEEGAGLGAATVTVRTTTFGGGGGTGV